MCAECVRVAATASSSISAKGSAGVTTLTQAEPREPKPPQRLMLVVLVSEAAELRQRGRVGGAGGLVVALEQVEFAEVGEADGLHAHQPAPPSLANGSLEDRPCLLGAVDADKDAGQVDDRADPRRVVERLCLLERLPAQLNRLRRVATMNGVEGATDDSQPVGLRTGLGERQRLAVGGLRRFHHAQLPGRMPRSAQRDGHRRRRSPRRTREASLCADRPAREPGRT
jgi:hypothetical protein